MTMTAEDVAPRVHTRGEHKRFSSNKLIDAMRGNGGDDEITAQQLAEMMGASVEAIARWMAGIAQPKPGYAASAAEKLGVSVEDLYE
jgi:transcriptional regulator with XRE-family HTH domain